MYDHPGSRKAQPGERCALTTLFWCTAGPGWVNKTGWQENENDLGKWCGIGLDPNSDTVTLLDLRRNRLSGALPPDVGDLKDLRHLYLGDNALQGLIPKSISRLSKLCILSLRGNKLKGEVIPELGDLNELRTLSLRDNHLSGTVPRELGQLTNLKHLFLNNNDICGVIPEELSDLEELEQMFLGDNGLEGPIPQSFGLLTRLEELVLSGNQLSGPIPSRLSHLTCLTRLELDGNCLTGDIPSSLGALSNLKILYLNNNQLTGPIPRCIGSLCWLERLDFSNNRLTGHIPPELGQLFNAEMIVLNNNRLTGPIPCEFGRLHRITLLQLNGNNLSEATPVMGGQGLKEWQRVRYQAYENSWSLVGRLAELERENAVLRQENDMLRKSPQEDLPVKSNGHGPEVHVSHVELSSDSTSIETAATSPTAAPTPATMAFAAEPGDVISMRRLRVASEESMGGTSAVFLPLGPPDPCALPTYSASASGPPGAKFAGDVVSGSISKGAEGGLSSRARLFLRQNQSYHGRPSEPSGVGKDDLGDRNKARRALLSTTQRRGAGTRIRCPYPTAATEDAGSAAGMSVRRGATGEAAEEADPRGGFGATSWRSRFGGRPFPLSRSQRGFYKGSEHSGQDIGFWNDDMAASMVDPALSAEADDSEQRTMSLGLASSDAGIDAPGMAVLGLSPLRSPMHRGSASHHGQCHTFKLKDLASADTSIESSPAGNGHGFGERNRSRRLWASLMGSRLSGEDLGDVSGVEDQEGQGRVSPISVTSPMSQFMPWLFQRTGPGGETDEVSQDPRLPPPPGAPKQGSNTKGKVRRATSTFVCSPE